MLNRCEFIGRVGADPEVRTFSNGGRVVNLRLAVAEKWKDKNSGERKEQTEWVSVAITNEGIGRVAEQYVSKGSQIYVAGKMQTRKWQDQSGNDRYSTEISIGSYDGKLVLLGDGNSGGGKPSQPAGGGHQPSSEFDDEIPF